MPGESERRFTEIYRGNLWGGTESVSGPGSSLDYTANLRNALPALFDALSIASVFDAPCGDFHWMKYVLAGHPLDYTGGDIVRPLIEDNTARYGTPRIRFIHIDLTREAYPRADLMIARDFLFHLSYEDTGLVLANFVKSGIKYLLTTTHANETGFSNRDIETGGFRQIDLFAPPYNFPRAALAAIEDWKPPSARRLMCLWSREQIAALFQNSAATTFSPP